MNTNLVDMRNYVLPLEVVEKEEPLIKLPKDVLISIIRDLSLMSLSGLVLSCKTFYSLVFENVKTIALKKEKELPYLPAIFKQVVEKSNKNVENLVIWIDQPQPGLINDKTLSSVAQFSILKTLVLGRTANLLKVTPEGLLHLTALKQLQLLELDHMGNVDSSSLTKVVSSLTSLTSLRIRGLTMASKDTLISSLATTSLERLGLWSIYPSVIKDSEFTSLRRQTRLKELILNTCVLETPDSFQHIAQLSHLRQLGIFCTRKNTSIISHKRMAELEILTDLTDLNLGGCLMIGQTFSASLCKFTNLTSLLICSADSMHDQFFNDIQPIKLENLRLGSINHISDNIFASLCFIPTLKRLNLDNLTFIGNTALEHISKHSTLSELHLLGLFMIDGQGINHLKNMPKLTTLSVQKCAKIDEDAINELRNSSLKEKGLKVTFIPHTYTYIQKQYTFIQFLSNPNQ